MLNNTGKARTEDFQPKLFTLSALPLAAKGAGAGIGRGVGGELAVELCKQRNAVGEPKLGAGGSQRGVLRRRRAVDDEARAGKRLERSRSRDPHVFMAKITIPKNNSATTTQMMMNLSRTC